MLNHTAGRLSALVVVVILCTGMQSSCNMKHLDGTAASEGEGAAASAAGDGKIRFVQLDANEDGWLSGTELDACDCVHLDTNSDGEVTQAEFLTGGAVATAANGGDGSPEPDARAAAGPAGAAFGGPPLGRYICRQYMTTMGYLTLKEGGIYEVSGVEGRYLYDPDTGEMEWHGGSYDEWDWEGVYEHVIRPAGDQRKDEDVIRLTSEADGLKINCYKMAEL